MVQKVAKPVRRICTIRYTYSPADCVGGASGTNGQEKKQLAQKQGVLTISSRVSAKTMPFHKYQIEGAQYDAPKGGGKGGYSPVRPLHIELHTNSFLACTHRLHQLERERAREFVCVCVHVRERERRRETVSSFSWVATT
jgi:hypothetical protein